MFLVPREKLPGCVGRGVGPARLLCKDFVVARTRAVEFDEWNVLCAVGGVSSRAARFRVTRPGVEWHLWWFSPDSPVRKGMFLWKVE